MKDKNSLAALLRLVSVPRWRLAWAVLLGALTVVFGVGLMATSGYLISRAAERPPILSLMVTIVAVQFFGIGRPFVRYLERLASHDMTLRVLGRLRARFFERIEPLAPAELDAYRKGDLLSRMVADVEALQNLYLRGLEPPLVALLAGALSVGATVALLPAAGLVLAGGLLVGGLAVPALAGLLGTKAGRRQASARGELSAELIESLQGAPELVAFGAEAAALDRVRAADRTLVKLASRDALVVGVGDGLELVVTGLTVAGVLAVAIAAHDRGALNSVLIATLALLALAASKPSRRWPRPPATCQRRSRLAGGCSSSPTAPRSSVTPRTGPSPQWPFAVALDGVTARYPGSEQPALDGVEPRLEPGDRIALLGPSGAGERRSRTCCCGSSIRSTVGDPGRTGGARLPRRRTFGGTRSRSPAKSRACSRRRSGTTSAAPARTRRGRSAGRAAARADRDGSARCPEGSRRRRGARTRAVGRAAPARRRSRGRARRRPGAGARRADGPPRSRRPRARARSMTCSRPPAPDPAADHAPDRRARACGRSGGDAV